MGVAGGPGATPGTIEVTETGRPVPGPRDVLLKLRACGICDAAFVQMGGMPLGPVGGVQGSTSEYVLIENARAGTSLAVFPDAQPFEIARAE
jgi:(R,R)-butanediol dehydrogenase / meso-butanediol dehydrogenase / diacetyl reductase